LKTQSGGREFRPPDSAPPHPANRRQGTATLLVLEHRQQKALIFSKSGLLELVAGLEPATSGCL